jgi:hypothetical protein
MPSRGSCLSLIFIAVIALGGCAPGEEDAASSSAPAATLAPAAPDGVSATAGNGQVSLSWNAVDGATSYNLYWSTRSGAAASGVTKTTGTKIENVTSPSTIPDSPTEPPTTTSSPP